MKAFLIISFLTSGFAAQAIIFSPNDLKEIHQEALPLAEATAVMISPAFYELNSNQRIDLNISSSNDDGISYNLCSDEIFFDQPSVLINCTGFLVAPNLILTAGHCATHFGSVKNRKNSFCESFQWLFDYRNNSESKTPLKDISLDKMISCQEVVSASFTSKTVDKKIIFGDDFALIRLDKNFPAKVLSLAKDPININDPVFTIGYPLGVPAKTSSGKVIKDNNSHYFITNLDTLGGQSGSPVFNKNNEVVGILVRSYPSDDFIFDEKAQCNRINYCDSKGKNCRADNDLLPPGSHVQKIPESIKKLIKFQ